MMDQAFNCQFGAHPSSCSAHYWILFFFIIVLQANNDEGVSCLFLKCDFLVRFLPRLCLFLDYLQSDKWESKQSIHPSVHLLNRGQKMSAILLREPRENLRMTKSSREKINTSPSLLAIRRQFNQCNGREIPPPTYVPIQLSGERNEESEKSLPWERYVLCQYYVCFVLSIEAIASTR